MSTSDSTVDPRLMDLYQQYAEGRLSRRAFLRGAAACAVGGLTIPTWMTSHVAAQAASTAPASTAGALDLAEWSYFWVGVERAHLARGTVVNGQQMYVEYFIPREVKHPYNIVLVHGGGGQGLDWMGTPDGRPGWAPLLVQMGYKVYVVDRPGHGRSPWHPETHGAFPAQAGTLENISGRFTPPNPTSAAQPGPYQQLHKQWPGTGEVGSRDLDQFVASQGGTYVTNPPPPGAAAAGRGGVPGRGGAPQGGPGAPAARGGAPVAFPAAPPPPLDGGVGAGAEIYHMVWRKDGAEMLDRIGPSIIMTHSAGGPFGWIVAEARPNLVKGIVAIEGGGAPFAGQNIWGLSDVPVAYDPPVSDPAETKTKLVDAGEPNVQPYRLQEEPVRRLKNLLNIPIVVVTAEGSFAAPGNPGAVAYLKQAGVKVAEELRLVNKNIHGNGHLMMGEKNNKEVLQAILDWVQPNCEKGVAIPKAKATAGSKDSTAMKLADSGFFWVGTEHKKMPYGTILAGQMFVQYLVPAERRHQYPIVLVHGGGGQMVHYMGVGGMSGWAHHYVQEGYAVYLVDRPGHGRSPFHPDALGPMGNIVNYAGLEADTVRSANGASKQWPGTGVIGDPLLDQLMAAANAAPADQVNAQTLWATRGAELLDKIGPAIIQVHSAGGPFGYLVADQRPNLVKAIVNVEGAGAGSPFGVTQVPLAFEPAVTRADDLKWKDVPAANSVPAYRLQEEPAKKLKNLQNIPMAYIVGEKSGRNGMPTVEFLKQAGCKADILNLKDKGILGNGHFMMLENNRRQVFDAINAWIVSKIS